MVEIPPNAVSMKTVEEWYRVQEQLKLLKNKEILLRSMIAKFYFPNPKEGTNTYQLPDGYAMKCKHTLNRDVDLGAFQALREQFAANGINADTLVKFKPELKTKEYRELTEEQVKLFDQCLIVKPGTPALEIVLPKKKGASSASDNNS